MPPNLVMENLGEIAAKGADKAQRTLDVLLEAVRGVSTPPSPHELSILHGRLNEIRQTARLARDSTVSELQIASWGSKEAADLDAVATFADGRKVIYEFKWVDSMITGTSFIRNQAQEELTRQIMARVALASNSTHVLFGAAVRIEHSGTLSLPDDFVTRLKRLGNERNVRVEVAEVP